MTAPDSGQCDHDEQLGRLAEELQMAIAAGEALQTSELAERFSVDENEVEKLIVALRAVQLSLGEDIEDRTTLAPPQLPDDYELGDELGRGGMGIVYRAHQKSLGRDVAIKVLRPGDLQFGDALQRFQREARSLARLRHRHIVSVHEVGKASGFVYFSMDLIEGMSLQQLVATGEMTTSRIVKLMRQIASAITYAHGQGVVHRDLKPANILVDGNDDAFVVDFGLSRDLDANPDGTLTGQLMGTPAYMSPEQVLGDRDQIGEAVDIYALGAVLYECLTGKRPFQGLPLAQLMHAVLETEPEPPRRIHARVPADLEVICMKAMQKRVADRYATVLAMAEDLERFSIGREILARRRSKTQRALQFAKRRKILLITAALPAALLLLFASLFLLPGMLRDREIELGNRLLAEGNDTGALLAYRSALAGEPAASLDPATQIRLARCLINRAGELQLHADSPSSDERQALLDEARQLLHAFEPARDREPETEIERETWRDTHYEVLRLDAANDSPVRAWYVVADILPERLRRDLAGPGRAATLILLASLLGTGRGNTGIDFDQPLCDAVVELIHQRHRLPIDIQNGFHAWFLNGDRISPLSGSHCNYLQAALIALVRDPGLDLAVRQDAAALLQHHEGLPFSTRFRKTTLKNGFTHTVVVDEADLQRLATAWDQLQGASRLDAYRTRVAFVAQCLFREARAAEGDEVIQTFDLSYWLTNRTGVTPRNLALWQVWWREHQHEDPRTWLLDALQWQIEPADLTAAMILQRFRQWSQQGATTQFAEHRQLFHHLLALTVDAQVAIPETSTRTPGRGLLVRWEKALGAVPEAQRCIRIASIAFANGDPRPHLIWQKRVRVGPNESASWDEWLHPQLALGSLHLEFGCPRWLRSAPGSIHLSGSASLQWQGEGWVGSVLASAQRMTPKYSINGILTWSEDLRPGLVTSCGGALHYPRGGQSYFEVLSLAVLEDEDAADDQWDLEAWRQALGNTIDAMAAMHAQQLRHHGMTLALASYLPLPEHKESLQRIHARMESADPLLLPALEEARRARLFAGDAAGIAVASQPLRRDTMPLATKSPPSDWVRLALSSEDSDIRNHAFEQLRGQPLLPALSRTLQRASADGLQLPEWLQQQVASGPGVFTSFVAESMVHLLGLLTALSLATISVRRAHRARNSERVRSYAILLWFSSLLIANYTVWIHDAEWNPPVLGHALNVLASWYACWRRTRSWGWIVPPLWWTGTTIAYLLGALHYDAFVWGAGALLFALMEWRSNGRRQRPRLQWRDVAN